MTICDFFGEEMLLFPVFTGFWVINDINQINLAYIKFFVEVLIIWCLDRRLFKSNEPRSVTKKKSSTFEWPMF